MPSALKVPCQRGSVNHRRSDLARKRCHDAEQSAQEDAQSPSRGAGFPHLQRLRHNGGTRIQLNHSTGLEAGGETGSLVDCAHGV
jgi:hypothetical protein